MAWDWGVNHAKMRFLRTQIESISLLYKINKCVFASMLRVFEVILSAFWWKKYQKTLFLVVFPSSFAQTRPDPTGNRLKRCVWSIEII